MTIKETFAEKTPDDEFITSLTSEATPLGLSVARILTTQFIIEGKEGLRQFQTYFNFQDEDIDDNQTGELAALQDRAQLEMGGIVLGTRLQYQERVFSERVFQYGDFITSLQSHILETGCTVRLEDPFPNLTEIDLGAKYLDAKRRKSNLSLEMKENYNKGNEIIACIESDRSLATLARQTLLIPSPVLRFLTKNGLGVCDYAAQQVYIKHARAAYLTQ